MSPVAGPLIRLIGQIRDLAGELGRSLDRDLLPLTARTGLLPLGRPGLWSPNRSCRLVRAAEGWIAVNLAREDDRDLLPAWLGGEPTTDVWGLVQRQARAQPWRDLVATARPLGLPVAGVGEVCASAAEAPLVAAGRPGSPIVRPLKVVDLSSLWAGPLCGAALAALGARVVKIESLRRPDPGRRATPAFYARLNGGKSELTLDFAARDDRARLRELVLEADAVITSARPRAFEQLGLAPAAIFAERPDLVWAAISGYGWTGPDADRVAFGDDAAAAGGLLAWTARGEPRFLGDALADPLTGLAAAAGALKALAAGGGVIVDAALARTAAGAAAELGVRKAA